MKMLNILKGGLLVGTLAMALSFLPFLGQKSAYAGTPSIKDVRGRQATELKLPIKYEKFAGKKVRIRLYVKDVHTGEERVTSHNRKLDNDGKVTLRVDNLTPGTLYKFKVKMKKQHGSSKYTNKSKSKTGSTKLQ